ncbi:MAG: XdhC family protein [Gammaproteobacteria bacterium]|nr:XdhC family protein [Gammaproteobacteria bacterium]
MPRYSTDREVLETAIRWLTQGRRLALVTVARTWGSSPRPVGALMVMRDDGTCSGSVSGGCVEEDLLMRYRAHQLGDSFPTLIDYGIDREEATRLGLPCGGRLELLVEQLDSAAPLKRLLDKIKAGQLVTRRVCMASGEVSLHAAAPADEFDYTSDNLAKVFGPRWQLLLIGDGHLARYVAQLALLLDYRVIICDPREDYEPDEPMEGVERVRVMPDEAVEAYATHPRCAVVALTHDPKLDDMALLDALQSPAFYIGALGSRRNSDLRRERLGTLGLTPQQLQRLHAPVGLPIGSRSPPEIAVSIMAEITALRHQAGQTSQRDVSAA